MTNDKQILVVEDDTALRQSLVEHLKVQEGFLAFQAATGKEALELVNNHQFEAILMDIGLPDFDGRELCRLMRRQGIKTPIIMLTALDTDPDMILSLNCGACDYVIKPFRSNVLLAKVRAQLR